MRQNPTAPVLAGGGVIAGTAALVVGLFSIGDCLRFQEQQGQCNEVVQEHALSIVLGALAIAGTIGGYFTVNPMLDALRKKEEGAGAVAGLSAFVAPSGPESKARWGGENAQAERVQFMRARGLSHQQIATATGVTMPEVASILAAAGDLEPGL